MIATIGRTAPVMIKSSHKHYLHKNGFMPDYQVWSIAEASEKTGYNQEYLRRLVRLGKVEATRIGSVLLIKVDSLKQYIREMEDSDDRRAGPRK